MLPSSKTCVLKCLGVGGETPRPLKQPVTPSLPTAAPERKAGGPALASRAVPAYVLHAGVGTDDVLDLVRVRILEGKGAGSHPEPFSVLGPETEHDGQNLAF